MEEFNCRAQHREFVQSVITRMNTNSFQIKGMMITIVAAFLAIYGANSKTIFIIIPIPIVLLFWFINSYYLQLERKFRGIYNDICDLTNDSEKLTTEVFLMNPQLYKGGKYSFWKAFFKSYLTTIYLAIMISLLISYFIIRNNCS